MLRYLIVLVSTVALAQSDELSSRVLRFDSFVKYFGIEEYQNQAGIRDVKIAILGTGLAGLEQAKGAKAEKPKRRYLPHSAEAFFEYPKVKGLPLTARERADSTDRRLAQLIWAMTGYSENGPQFRVFNAKGLVNYREAVRQALDWGAHIIVSNVSFTSFGNFDGTGPVNLLVEDASARDVIWIQGAGEFRKSVYNGLVSIDDKKGDKEKWLRFNKAQQLEFKVNSDNTDVTITLSWNAFSAGRRFRGTDRDLDLYVYTPDKPKEPLISKLRQVKGEPDGEKEETNLAVEQVTLKASARKNAYKIAVKYVGGDFTAENVRERSRIRVTVTTDKRPTIGKDSKEILPVDFVNATDTGSIMIPADAESRHVIVVGDTGDKSSVGPTTDGREKPDLKFEKERALVLYSDTEALSGSYYGVPAAQFAAMAAVYKAKETRLRHKHLLMLIRDSKKTPNTNEKQTKAWRPPTPRELRTLVVDNP